MCIIVNTLMQFQNQGMILKRNSLSWGQHQNLVGFDVP